MKTDNELIAEFMGFTFAFERGHRVYNVPKGEDLKYAAFKLPHVKLNYDSSWDWLMPVVEKINTMEPSEFNYHVTRMTEFRICQEKLQMYSITTPINQVYKMVVDFIKWYNQTKKP